MKFLDLTGHRYGRLTVAAHSHKHDSLGHHWICDCDCGKQKVIRGASMRAGRTTSCGCVKSEHAASMHLGRPPKTRKPYGVAAQNILFSRYKKSAKERGVSFCLDKSECLKMFGSECFYCGSSPSSVMFIKGAHGEFVYNGIDRLNSDLGYEKGNVVPCCWVCNRAKGSIGLSEFIAWVSKVRDHIESKAEVVRAILGEMR